MTGTPVADVTQRSSRATWGLVCGVIAAVSAIPFVPGPYFEFLFGAAAVILGILGIRDATAGMRGKGFAVAAIVLGVVVIAYKLVVGVFLTL